MAEREVPVELLERALTRVRGDLARRVPAPPLAQVVRTARARRFRQRMAAVAVAAGVVVAGFVAFGDEEPRSLAPVERPPAAAFLTPDDAQRSMTNFASIGAGVRWQEQPVVPDRLDRPETCTVPLPGEMTQVLVPRGDDITAVVSQAAQLPDEGEAAAAYGAALDAVAACPGRPIFDAPVEVSTAVGEARVLGLAGEAVSRAVYTQYVVVARSGRLVVVTSVRLLAQAVSRESDARALATRVIDRLASAQ